MKKTRMEKGITLVALIITIVILLILAVVAISSIQDNGLIGKVSSATSKWNESVKNEQGILDDYLEFLEVGPDIGILKKYVLGEENKGRLLKEILSGTTFKNEESTIPNASEEVKLLSSEINGTERLYYIKYKNNIYNIAATGNLREATTNDIKLIYAPQGREGTEVLYDSNGNGIPEKWTVITDRNGKLEIVSSTARSGLTLGGEDIESAVESYNKVITNINNYCAELITADKSTYGGVRSIGTSAETEGTYTSTYFSNWLNEQNISLKAADESYKLDYAKILCFGIADVDCIFASRYVNALEDDGEYYEDFCVRGISAGKISNDYGFVFEIYTEDGTTEIYSEEYEVEVRPVVINPVLTPVEEDKVEYDEFTIDNSSDSEYSGQKDPVVTVNLGDVNGDGSFDTFDITKTIKLIQGGTFTSRAIVAADVNKDGVISEEDIDLVNAIVKGQRESETVTGKASGIRAKRIIKQQTETLN